MVLVVSLSKCCMNDQRCGVAVLVKIVRNPIGDVLVTSRVPRTCRAMCIKAHRLSPPVRFAGGSFSFLNFSAFIAAQLQLVSGVLHYFKQATQLRQAPRAPAPTMIYLCL